MRKTVFLLVLIFFAKSSFSQPWMKLIPEDKVKSGSVNFYDVQKVFNEYWKDKKIERSHGWKQFKRWENFMEPRVYPSGKIPENILWKEYLKLNQQKSNIANWTPLGPFPTPMDINTTSARSGSGRINCIAFHPTDPNIIWVGSPSGGLWKSTSGGNSWTTTTDALLSIGVSDIAVNPSDPNIIYIATGDGDANDTYSVGILKSTDGGNTWNVTGNSISVTDGIVYRKLLINPVNNNVLLAASSSGIYKTTNGGNTWTNVQTGYFKDLQYKPGNPDEVYATLFDHYGGAAIYKSTNGGNTFSELNTGIPANDVNRIALGVTPANPSVVYALCSDASDNGFHSVYKTTNNGTTWTQMVSSAYGNLLGWQADASGSGGQGWYDLTMAVSPTDANTVFIGGVNIWKSADGGANWQINAHWAGDDGIIYVHADQHMFRYNTLNNILYAGNDGGIYKTEDGALWTDLSDGLQILQIYRMGASATNPKIVVTGTQDNGSMKYDDGQWWSVLGGDGMEGLVDYSDDNRIYGEYYYGSIYRSDDGGYNFYSVQPSGAYNGAWITPYIIHPTDHNTLFMGFDEVYKTTDGGLDWSVISSGMTGGSNLQSLAISQSNPNYIYAATYTNIWKTTNGGTSWTEITNGLNGYMTYIAVSDSDPNSLWVTFSGYSDGEKVFRSTNGGTTWTNFSTGLPNLPANCIVYEKNNSNNALYVGTDVGVYYRNATMSQWMQFSTGLPNVIVDELEIQYATKKIRAATYGRGLWESDLYEEPGMPQADFGYQVESPCEGLVNFYNTSSGVPTQWHWYFGDGATSAQQNPSHLYPSLGSFPVKLIVSNSFGIDSIQMNVTINSLPVQAAFAADNAVTCSAPASVHFINQSTNGVSYLWYFGDGAVSTEQSPYHTYTSAGTFNVKLITYGGFCGNDSISQDAVVNINPTNVGNQSMLASGNAPVQTCCTGTLYDSGGQGYYQNNTHSTLTVAPVDASSITLNFLSFDFEPGPNNSCGYDYLAVYDGPNITSPLIGEYCNNNYPPFSITSAGGSITIEQYSDPGVTGTGFEIDWSCVVSGIESIGITESKPFLVYPNPSDGSFMVEFFETREYIDLKVFDITGKEFYQSRFDTFKNSSRQIDLKNASNGLYLLQIRTDKDIFNTIISVE
ncbi:MAG: PKD domain-containing protein [Bacteroidia bacterium]|nr:PKD domain-containing protein [Bacteroidia bacterium]